MNKKFLMVALLPLVLLVMVAPVVAKPLGPRDRAVEQNRHLQIPAEGEVELYAPGGVGHIWAETEIGVMDSCNWKNASKYKIRNAISLTVDDFMNLYAGDLTYENKWTFIELQVILDFIDIMLEMGAITEAEAQEAIDMFEALFPEGMYLLFVNVGK
jgi:hypothetical protein